MTDLEQAFQRWRNEIGNIENDIINYNANVTAAINAGRNTDINAFITAAYIVIINMLQQLELRLQNDAQLMEERIVKYIVKYNLDKLLPLTRQHPKIFDDLQNLQRVLREHVAVVQQRIVQQSGVIRSSLQPQPVQQQGLTAARIEKFQQFPADESLVGDRCSVCQMTLKLEEE